MRALEVLALVVSRGEECSVIVHVERETRCALISWSDMHDHGDQGHELTLASWHGRSFLIFEYFPISVSEES